MTHLAGLVADRRSTREADRESCLYEGAGSSRATIMQTLSKIRNQRRFPSCAGQALAACIDAIEGMGIMSSGVSIWREARRRQGKIERIDDGTRFEYAVSGLVFRGWDPYQPGEDRDQKEAGLGAPDAGDDLADEMFADDHRISGWKRYRILGDRLERVDAALAAGQGVVIGTGTRDEYQEYQGDPNQLDSILTTDHLGGSSNGHGQRVFARQRLFGDLVYGIQNSWGLVWGGCHLPDGTWQPGCCWVEPSVILQAWDIHVIGKF